MSRESLVSSMPSSVVMSITSHYPELRYIRNAQTFCKEFLKRSFTGFISPEIKERLVNMAFGCSWEESRNMDAKEPTMAEVIAAFR